MCAGGQVDACEHLSEERMQRLSQKTSSIASPWFCDEEKSVLLKAIGDVMVYLKRKNDSMSYIIDETDSQLLLQMKYYK